MEDKIYSKIIILIYSLGNESVKKLEFFNSSYTLSGKYFIINEHSDDGIESTPYDMEIIHRYKIYNKQS